MFGGSAGRLLLACALANSARPPAAFDSCSGAIQDRLRYGISGRAHPEGPLPVSANETLAEAVCCDSRAELLAEPQLLFEQPDSMSSSCRNSMPPFVILRLSSMPMRLPSQLRCLTSCPLAM